MSSTGAIAAYKGYRTQALYALHRILKSQLQGIYFQPEKYEDLSVYKDSGEILEVIQVKDLTVNLSLSDFVPGKSDSFFRRALKLIKENPGVRVNIMSFGPIGPEMCNAWAGDSSFQSSISKKLSNHGFSSIDVETLFSNIEIQTADESTLKDDIFSFLRSSSAGGDPENAFDLLSFFFGMASRQRYRKYRLR